MVLMNWELHGLSFAWAVGLSDQECHSVVPSRHIRHTYRQKRKRYNVISIGYVYVFANTGLKYVVPKLPINQAIT